MTNGQNTMEKVSCEDIIWSISSWVATKLNDSEQFELTSADQVAIAKMATQFNNDFASSDLTLIELLRCMDSPHAEEDTKNCVHLSALREALTCVGKAYYRFPQVESEGRVAAYRAHLELIERAAVAKLATPLFTHASSGTGGKAVALK